MLNPNIQDSPSIMIQYVDYGASKPLTYPDLSDVLQLAANEMKGVSKYGMHTITLVFIRLIPHMNCSCTL